MKLNKTARILASLALGLSLCVFSCEKPANTLVIPVPPSKPNTGTGSGSGSGSGGGSGTGDNNGGSGPSTGSGTETSSPKGLWRVTFGAGMPISD